MIINGQHVSSTAGCMYSVLCSLCKSSSRNGHTDVRGAYSYASRKKLGTMIERSERTAQRAVKELSDAGLIFVRRMGLHANDRIYISYYGRSETVKNGGSEIIKDSNNIISTSVYPANNQMMISMMTDTATDNANKPRTPERIGATEAATLQDNNQQNSKMGETPKKGVATPRRPRMTKAEKDAARERYRCHLEKKLDMYSIVWMCPEFQEEFEQRCSLIDLISNAMSVTSNTIRVNGATLTRDQYWNVVKDIDGAAIQGLLDRVYTQEICGKISNKCSYLLASVYNAVLWQKLTTPANVDYDALYASI